MLWQQVIRKFPLLRSWIGILCFSVSFGCLFVVCCRSLRLVSRHRRRRRFLQLLSRIQQGSFHFATSIRALPLCCYGCSSFACASHFKHFYNIFMTLFHERHSVQSNCYVPWTQKATNNKSILYSALELIRPQKKKQKINKNIKMS